MARRLYRPANFRPATLEIIDHANFICEEMDAQGFSLTLRQLYYQFVQRGLIPNTPQDYKRLGSIVNDGRLAGLIDWDYIVDRTRNVKDLAHWGSSFDTSAGNARAFIENVMPQFRIPKWGSQETRIEVWIEKEALLGVIEGICEELDVPYFACRGNPSQSEVREAVSSRFARYLEGPRTQSVLVLYLGDHDPNGLDISRDVEDRFDMFAEGDGLPAIRVRRIALNIEQVRALKLPPNPAKETDSRFGEYRRKYGNESWELDALSPATIVGLIRREVERERNDGDWAEAKANEADGKNLLAKVAERWSEIVELLEV